MPIDRSQVKWDNQTGIDPSAVKWDTPPSEPGIVQRAISAISGKGRSEENIGEFSPGFDLPNPMGTAAGVLVSTTEQQIADVLKEKIPGAEFSKDKFGNLLVKAPGRDFEYINKPGLTSRDVKNAIAQAGAFILGSKVGAGVTGAAMLPVRSAVQAISAAGTSIGLDAAAGAAGSKQGVDIPKAVVVGAGGGLVEMMAPVFSQLMRFTTGAGRIPTLYEARLKMGSLGFDPKDLTDETVKKFIEISRKAANPETAARYAEAQGLPVPVPTTKGQNTMLARDQMFEDLAGKGAYGEGAERIMRGQAQLQEDALRANIPAIQSRIGGTNVQRNDAGRMVQSDLLDKASGLNRVVGERYDLARASVGKAPEDVGQTVYQKVLDSVVDFTPHAPGAQTELNNLKNIISKSVPESKILSPSGFPVRSAGIELQPADVKALYDWRRKITTLGNNAKDRTEAAAFKAMKSAFDDSLDDAMISSLSTGDAAAVDAWKKAISARKTYGKVFESGDLVEKLIEKESGQLKIAPEATSNVIFGVSDTQLISRPELARELVKLKKIVSPETWDAIREEAFLRLAQKGEAGAFQGGKRTFSGVNLKKAVDEMKIKNAEVYNTLFDDSEKAVISQFANVAARLTNPVKGGSNFSNTAVGLSNIVQKVGETLLTGQKGQAFLSRIFPNVYEGIMIGPAASAARGGLPLKQLPPGISGALGAEATNLQAQ